jgi:hypothetical protein
LSGHLVQFGFRTNGGWFLDFSKNHQFRVLLQNLQGIINFHERPAGSVLVLFQFINFLNVCWFGFGGVYHKKALFSGLEPGLSVSQFDLSWIYA